MPAMTDENMPPAKSGLKTTLAPQRPARAVDLFSPVSGHHPDIRNARGPVKRYDALQKQFFPQGQERLEIFHPG